MLQTNPNNRPSCDQLLSNETVVKRISLIKEGKEVVNEPQPIQLLKTIKLPRNMNEINQVLPKKKKYKEEMEEVNLMNFDVNSNAKKNQIDMIGNNGNIKNENLNSIQNQNRNKEKEIELINQVNNLLLKDKNDNKQKERENLINNQNNINKYPIQSGPSKAINYHNYNHNQGVLNNNVVNIQRGVQMPNQINNIISTPIPNDKKDVYNNNLLINRPSSGKSDPNANNINRPKTPILAKNENNHHINPNNVNYHIYNSQNKNPQQVKLNNNIVPPNKVNIIQPSNDRDAVVKVIMQQQKILASPVQNNPYQVIGSNRPQSAKVNIPSSQNDLKNKLNQVKQANDQIIRKNLGTPLDRPSSPGKALNNQIINNKRQVVNSSPKNRSPPKNGPVQSRPSSGKEKTPIYILNNGNNQINSNNQMLLRNQNDKKIVIEKVIYQKGQIQSNKIVDPRKGNYQNNPTRDQLNVPNKNNLINVMRNNNNPVHANMVSPSPNNNLGPRIAYIKK
jgi:hypothetical protein